MKRIAYIQYTNPAAYPPLIHSSTILAEHGWDVLFVAIAGRGAAQLSVPITARVRYAQLGKTSGGVLGSLRYMQYLTRAVRAVKRFRADWCYASDALSAPIALGCRKLVRTRLLYHEHDAPAPRVKGRGAAIVSARNQVAATADIVVAPSAARMSMLPVGRGKRMVVWNCPRVREVGPERTDFNDGAFRVVYHGSLSRERLTPQFIDALLMLPQSVELHVYGYETQGHRGYADELEQRARAAGVGARFFHHGVIPDRNDLLGRLRNYHLGIATVDTRAGDRNLCTLAGASNKAFEYMSAGLPLLISPDADWQQLFAQPAYAVTCEPTDVSSIAAAVGSLVTARDRAQAMGEAGRQRVLTEWNYDIQFQPVLAELTQ